jgi:multimeric flavodoxin WrbA
MPKYLLISGSQRNGNTEFVLSKILDSLDVPSSDKELILLKNKNIKHCIGCLRCHITPKCAIKDDMTEILGKMRNAEVLIIGTPNYFGNVTGLMKDFIDRTHPVYNTSLLKGKKVILIMVGGSEAEKSAKYLAGSMEGFIKYQKLDLIGSYCFQALNADELKKDSKFDMKLKPVMQKIKSIKTT